MKKFTFLIVALLVAAMGFAQTKNSGAKIGPYHFMKPAKHINHSTRATRAAVFSEDFESDGLPTGWTVLDADGDGYNWETLAMTNESFASGYGHNSDGAAVSWSYYPTSQSSQGWSGNSLNTNDYLITPQITVPAGDSKLVFYVASFNGSAYPDDIEVKISTTGTAAEDFTTLIANETVTASVPNFVERSVSLNAYAEQQVYIAFVHQSEDCFGIILDDVSVMEIPPYDIAVTNVSFSNGSGCDLTTTDMIVTVKNNGTEAITAFSLEYSINEGTPVNVNVTANIASGSTYQHTIEGLDVSTEGIYNISVTATLENDADNSNNTNTGTVAHLAPATIPYNNTFDTNEEVAGCSIINANNDAVAWGIYTLDEEAGDMVPAILSGNAENGNNDYFVTNCITMAPGTYRMTVDIQGGGQELDWNTFSYVTYYDDLSIVFGTAPTVEALTNHIYDSTGYFGQETLVKDFVIAEAGTYYFAFRVSSANGYQSFINNLNIQEVLAHDISIIDVDFANATGCGLTSNSVIVTVKNDGTDAISSFGLSYAVNEGTPVEVTVTPAQAIASDSVYTYTFEQAITIDADGDYDVVVNATLEGDTNTDGNEAEASFSRLAPETLPYTLVIDDEDALTGWTIIDANDDDTTWEYSDGDGIEYSYNADNAANDWAISSCITMPAGAYKFSFSHSSSSSYPESLKVFYGNAPTIEAMTNMIEDYPSLTGSAVDSKNFTVEADGTYYLGFYCYSAADMYYLNIDSIHIEAIPPYEASISNLTFGTPSGCGIESSTISATITNNGSVPMTAFTAAYKVNDNEPVLQEFTLENAIALDSSYVFTFETPMALTEAGEYNVVAYITLAGDENHANDTVNGSIEKMVPEIALTAVTPATGARIEFGETVNIAGTVTNNSCALTSYIVTYKVGDGEFVANDTIECNVAQGATHNFTHTIAFTPEAAGDYTITVKVSKPNDTEDVADDNEMTTTISFINTAEIALTSVAPATGSTVHAGEGINISGVITNNGVTLSSYKVAYTVDGGEAVEYTVSDISVALGETHNFTHATPVVLETAGAHTIVVTVSEPNGAVDGDDSDNSMTITLNAISCEPISTFPYTEGFENGLSECWTTIDADGDGYGWVLGSATDGIYLNGGNLSGAGYGESADMMVSGSYSNVSGALTPDNWLITPAISLPAGSPASISFFAAAQDAQYATEHYGVYVSTTTTDPSAFTLIWEENMNSNGGTHRAQGTWGEKHADLSNYAGQTIYIGFRHFNCTDQFIFLIDDVTVALVSATEENIAEAIAVYPNPTSDMVTIANAEGKDIIVVNSLGQVVASIENAAANQTIDVSNFANGTYFVKVDAEVVKLNVVK